ncbi:hypothetical protein HID58_012381, partial [Brassica napus]
KTDSSRQYYSDMAFSFDLAVVLQRDRISSSSSPDLDVSTMLSLVVDQDLTIPAMEGYSVSQIFHGLMCFTNEQSAQIYNTTTRQLVVLPTIEESSILVENDKSKRTMYGIGHDSVHDQYKVFCTVSKRGERRTLNISIDSQETTRSYVFLYNIQKNHMRRVGITK